MTYCVRWKNRNDIFIYSGDIDNSLKCNKYLKKLVDSEDLNVNTALQIISETIDIISEVTLIVGFIVDGVATLCKVENAF